MMEENEKRKELAERITFNLKKHNETARKDLIKSTKDFINKKIDMQEEAQKINEKMMKKGKKEVLSVKEKEALEEAQEIEKENLVLKALTAFSYLDNLSRVLEIGDLYKNLLNLYKRSIGLRGNGMKDAWNGLVKMLELREKFVVINELTFVLTKYLAQKSNSEDIKNINPEEIFYKSIDKNFETIKGVALEFLEEDSRKKLQEKKNT